VPYDKWEVARVRVAAMSLVSLPRQASGIDRLTDEEVKELFDTIEDNRSKFEGALDDKQKNTTIRDARGEECSPSIFAASRRRTTPPCPTPDSKGSAASHKPDASTTPRS
jgi:hypothetical protein